MTGNDPLLSSPLDAGFRAAHQALRMLAPSSAHVSAEDGYLPILVEELEDLVRLARDTAAASIGPTFRWPDSRQPDDTWPPVIMQIDLDDYSDNDPPDVSNIDDWENSALALAGRAYRRDCRWDFSPDESGIWLLFVAPYSAIGGGDRFSWSGTVAGFLILHDRDNDGEYESLAHLWTASSWRRRGVAARLVREALERFPVSHLEGPVTDEGWLLLENAAPELLEQPT